MGAFPALGAGGSTAAPQVFQPAILPSRRSRALICVKCGGRRNHRAACAPRGARYVHAPMRAPPILALKEVRLADGPVMLFDGVDLALDARSRACLVGRNGAGKSTLLRILAGEIQGDAGERTVSPGSRIAYVPQE